MGGNDYGPKWLWAEMVMGRSDPEPIILLVLLHSWFVSYLVRNPEDRFSRHCHNLLTFSDR